MIRLQNNYAITSSGGSFALVTFVKGKDKDGNEIDVQKQIESKFEQTKDELLKEFEYLKGDE